MEFAYCFGFALEEIQGKFAGVYFNSSVGREANSLAGGEQQSGGLHVINNFNSRALDIIGIEPLL